MKPFAGSNDRPNKTSELLNGKRPAADARLIRDILDADKPSGNDRDPKSTPSAKRPQPVVLITHEAYCKAQSAQGTVKWDSFSSSS